MKGKLGDGAIRKNGGEDAESAEVDSPLLPVRVLSRRFAFLRFVRDIILHV